MSDPQISDSQVSTSQTGEGVRRAPTRAEAAFAEFLTREGLTAAQGREFVCRRARIGEGHLKNVLRDGSDCWACAERLRRAMGCPTEVFLHRLRPRPEATNQGARARAGRNRTLSKQKSRR